MKIHDLAGNIQRSLAAAGLDPQSTLVQGIGATIRKALAASGQQRPPGWPATTVTTATHADADADIVDVEARVLDAEEGPPAAPSPPPPASGRFFEQTHRGPAGSRQFKLYVPAACGAQPAPLIVMLHGCQQDPDDFALGTRMNELADRHGFIVAYPRQPTGANHSNCWNWFEPRHQRRDDGEPSLIAGIVRQIERSQHIDRQRIYVAGMSAGAAMALILGRTHPDLFAAVGAHSGLPYGAAQDMATAFAAMRGAAATPARAIRSNDGSAPPTIVFHGDSDRTVHAANADAVVRQLLAAANPAAHAVADDEPASRRSSIGGRDTTITVFTDTSGRVRVEQWLIHGAAHAWSGGNPAGSFTDAEGPDASAEMVRFFLGHRQRRPALQPDDVASEVS
jgi:poly(hydroxyalkanoate) depolymerase family esterase